MIVESSIRSSAVGSCGDWPCLAESTTTVLSSSPAVWMLVSSVPILALT
jgi:hypothetical protein